MVDAAQSDMFVCDLTAFAAAERAAHIALSTQLFGELIRATQELDDGYAFRFDAEHYPAVAAFVAGERRCCPFLRFRLDVTPNAGPVWLQLTAAGDARPFLRAELGIAAG